MTNIEIGDRALQIETSVVQIEASVVAQGLQLEPSSVHTMMRNGEITGLCERGVDEDAGRYRLTFFHKNRHFRLVVDETGTVVQRSSVNLGDRPLPASMRSPRG
jgi:hypothetical protein